MNLWCNREFYIPLSRQRENLSLTGLFHLAGCSSGHKPKRVLRLERRLRIKYTMLQQHWVILRLTSERKSHRDELSMCMCGSGNLMNQSLLHQSWSKWGSRCSFPFLSYLLFLFFPAFFHVAVPPPRPCPTQQTSLCGMHDIQLNNNHKKEFQNLELQWFQCKANYRLELVCKLKSHYGDLILSGTA